MPKSQAVLARGENTLTYTITGPCGYYMVCNTEKQRNLILKLHCKKCDLCRNANTMPIDFEFKHHEGIITLENESSSELYDQLVGANASIA